MLERNKTAICPGSGKGAAERLHVMEGDAMTILPTLQKEYYDRIIAPRPKEGASDGDLGTGDAGVPFLLAMLPLLKSNGEMHWYDFASDHELPECDRTRKTLESACQSLGLEIEILHVSKAGSVAKRQWRVCVDFRIIRP
jgi:tRNA G37 N-methylase Trm5